MEMKFSYLAAAMTTYEEILQQYWGYAKFRPLQQEIIESVCQGNDTLGLMPTGGGKSITFQVAALSKPGLCIVITPLSADYTSRGGILRRASAFSKTLVDRIAFCGCQK